MEEDAKECKIMLQEELQENIEIPIRQDQIKLYNLIFTIKKANGKQRQIQDAKTLNKQIADFHTKLPDSNEVKQTIKLGDWSTSQDLSFALHHLIFHTETHPNLELKQKNIQYIYSEIPFGTKQSSIFFATAMEPIMQQIRMKIEIKIANYVDSILLRHKNKEYSKNMTQKVIDTVNYFGFTMNMENSETEQNQAVIFLGWEWNLANATFKTKPKKSLLLRYVLNNTR
ncbi:MAG: hypothetical protein EZS28_009526 [Streblomastix strix]|uniref:Reverse transcriptase domain-containing protein n=1 Tax=Streblomastix strix TaxID=222440 RepID=A0A5J4WKR9_9EUKA|nr:MAG: hypothetical protein EZS28_009526 [Streblomastix strix]